MKARLAGRLAVLEVVGASRDAIRLYEERGWRLLAMYPWGEDLHIYYYGAPRTGVGS